MIPLKRVTSPGPDFRSWTLDSRDLLGFSVLHICKLILKKPTCQCQVSCHTPSLAQTLQGASLPICIPNENAWVYMILLVQRILLAVLDAAGDCARAQPLTTYNSASEHVNAQVTAAELLYLRHLRSCAASASGKRSTCSGGRHINPYKII